MSKVTVLVKDVKNNREEFLAARKGKLGCSDLPALCGLSKWQSPLELWMRLTGRTEPQEDSDTLWFGREIEPIILSLVERRRGVKVTPVNQVWVNSDYPLLIGSPDAKLENENEETGLVEAKSAGIYQREQWGKEKAPDAAHLQLQGQLGIAGFSWGCCAGLIGGSVKDFYMPEFKFEQSIFDQAYERVEHFMRLVHKDIPPQAQAGDEPMLELLYGVPKENIIDFNPAGGELLRLHQVVQKERAEFNRRSKILGEQLDDIEVKLRQMLGDAKGGLFEGKGAFLKLTTRKGYEVAPSEKWVLKIVEIEDGE